MIVKSNDLFLELYSYVFEYELQDEYRAYIDTFMEIIIIAAYFPKKFLQ